MANTLKPKRSSVAGNIPTTTNLSSGEMGVNMADQKVWINNGTSVVQIGSGKVSGLADVVLSSLATGQGLSWNGTNWVNSSAGSGTVTSVSGTGTVSGLTLTGSVTGSGSLTLGGTLSLTSGQVTTALGFTPYNSTNPSGYITSSASISGNAATATALQTARTINGVSFNGTANITVADSTKLPLSGGILTGPLIFGNATSPNTQTIQFGDNTGWTLRYMTSVSGTPTERFRFVDTGAFNAVGAITQNGNQVLHAGNFSSYAPSLSSTYADPAWITSIASSKLTGTIDNARLNGGTYTINVTGNAGTATTLQTARTINGVSFNGSANITVADSTKLPLTGGTLSGVLTINSTSDNQLLLQSTDSWTGIGFNDSAPLATDYIWHNGTNGTFALGGGGANVAGKKLHVHGGMTVGANYAATTNPTNGLNVEGAIQQAGNQVLHAGNYASYSPSLTGAGASGTWNISITGSVASSNAVNGLTLTSSANGINPDSVTQNQLGYNTSVSLFGQTDGGLYSSAHSSSWIHQIYGDFRTGQIATRGKNSGTWQAWRVQLDSGNFSSYSPSLTGSGASGTWGISITGTANGLSSSNYINRTGSSGNLNTDFSNTPAGTQRYQGDDSNLTNSPGGTWWIYENKRHSNSSNVWGTQVAWGWEDNSNRLMQRNVSGNSWSGWVEYLNTGGRTFSGNLTMSGNISGNSDERLKTNWREMPENFVARLAKVRVGIYDRLDEDGVTQVGVSAQSFQELLPQAIMTAKDELGTLAVSYGNAALASAVELAKDNVDLRARVAKLEALVSKLIEG